MSTKTVRPHSEAEKQTHTTVDTISFTPDEARSWHVPPFQREVKVNTKVSELAATIKRDGGVLPGVITFAIVAEEKERGTQLIDGQQRREAFLISEQPEGFADVRTVFCKTTAEAAEEFVRLNSHLVCMKPDDILRGMQPVYPVLEILTTNCPFTGYSYARNKNSSVLLSVSAIVRAWHASHLEVPGTGAGRSSADIVRNMTIEDTDQLTKFLKCCYAAWGRDIEHNRLWSSLNITLCAWLYRRLVISISPASRVKRIDDALFTKCLMKVGASEVYYDFLRGRNLGERNRSPVYNRLKEIIASVLTEVAGSKQSLPQPAWAS